MKRIRSARSRGSSASRRSDYLSQLDASGLSVRAFASRHGLSASTLYQWRWQRRRSEGATTGVNTGPEAGFHTIQIPSAASPTSTWDVELVLPGGVVVRTRQGCPSPWLRELLSLLP